jgi:hypothetical protein
MTTSTLTAKVSAPSAVRRAEGARWQLGFPGGWLSRVNNRVARLALTTVWESMRAPATDDQGQVAAKRALMRRAALR